jgi:hypothetical protein
MNHFSQTLYSACCGNYTCYGCASQYLASRGVACPPGMVVRCTPSWVPCCHCTQRGVRGRLFRQLVLGAPVRSYADEARDGREGGVGDQRERVLMDDSFEVMKDKMRRLDDTGAGGRGGGSTIESGTDSEGEASEVLDAAEVEVVKKVASRALEGVFTGVSRRRSNRILASN